MINERRAPESAGEQSSSEESGARGRHEPDVSGSSYDRGNSSPSLEGRHEPAVPPGGPNTPDTQPDDERTGEGTGSRAGEYS